jgi:solute carrier family 25 (mitochondrial carnitine/acylcarnitine transporter), member 20/29
MAAASSSPSPSAASVRLVGDGSASSEAMRGLVCGTIYGLTSPLIGHPLDTVKTKMQAQAGYMTGSALRTLTDVVRKEGFLALYRGLLPPLVGSSIFRSVQFSVYAAAYGAAGAGAGSGAGADSLSSSSSSSSPFLTREVPGTGGLQVRVLTSGLVASLARALIETPLELIKVRRQTGQAWLASGSAGEALRNPVREARNLYQGFGVAFVRTWGLMGSFFVMVDVLERNHADLLAIPVLGPFMKGGVCATAAWVLVWPFEVLKNQIQAGTNAGAGPNAGWAVRARYAMASSGGVRGLYRGIGPGLLRSVLANGSSMVAFNFCQTCFRDAQSGARGLG